MLNFFFYYISCIDSKSTHSVCKFPNMHADEAGNCVCNQGYYGDPNNPQIGCWTCPKKCHNLAFCAYPGTCTCAHGLYGNGVTCQFPIPKYYTLDIPKVLKTGGFYLHIHVPPILDFEPTHLYCQIGSKVFESFKYNDSIAEFIIPMYIYGYNNITVSFDSINWSPDMKRYYFQKTYNEQFIQESIPFVLALLVVVTIGTCLLHGKNAIFEKEEEILLPHKADIIE